MNKLLLPLIVLVASCQSPRPETKESPAQTFADPLSYWNDTATKKTIIDYVTSVSREGDPKFVPVAERIAVFDNDGTLWCEQPLYFEFVYSIASIKKIAEKVPALQKKPEIKALVSGDMKTFMKSGEQGILEAFAISHTAISTEEFSKDAKAWLDTAVHKRFGKKYSELTYKPMVELLKYLRDNQFTTYIVSGGSSMFIRTFSEGAYGIPPGQVIGTMFKADFVAKDNSYEVLLKPELFHMDNDGGKPVALYQFVGRKPILAFGNSDGDLQMLEWTSTHFRPNLSLILHHTDSVREYAYDKDSSVGKLDKALTEGMQKGWVIVDMKKDFNKVFSFE